MAQKPKQ